MRTALILLAGLILGAGLWLLAGCPDKGRGGSGRGGEGIATVPLPGVSFDVRLEGETDFRAGEAGRPIPQGATLRTREALVALRFTGRLQNLHLILKPKSILILEGEVRGERGPEYVFGLQQGEVEINSYADEPVVVKMPHATARAVPDARAKPYFKIEGVRPDREGRYRAMLQVLSIAPFTVTNRHGSITLTDFADVRVDEAGPPRVLKRTRMR